MSSKLNGSQSGNNKVASSSAAKDPSGQSTTSSAKLCTVCGTNLVGEKRYKDAEGRYWCCDCAKADKEGKVPATCPDCNQQFPLSNLTEFEGNKLCNECVGKRQHAAKRAAQRKAAAEEEARLQQKRHRLTMIIAGAAAAAMIAFAAFRLMR